MSLLDADDDWMEGVRKTLYPKLHPILKRYTPAYSIGQVKTDGYVCNLEVKEEEFEDLLVTLGFQRNPIAAYKSHPDGMKSEGSWVLRGVDDTYLGFNNQYQLHVTLFREHYGLTIYAHLEDDWRINPIAHLRCKNLQPAKGSELMAKLLLEKSYFSAAQLRY